MELSPVCTEAISTNGCIKSEISYRKSKVSSKLETLWLKIQYFSINASVYQCYVVIIRLKMEYFLQYYMNCLSDSRFCCVLLE